MGTPKQEREGWEEIQRRSRSQLALVSCVVLVLMAGEQAGFLSHIDDCGALVRRNILKAAQRSRPSQRMRGGVEPGVAQSSGTVFPDGAAVCAVCSGGFTTLRDKLRGPVNAEQVGDVGAPAVTGVMANQPCSQKITTDAVISGVSISCILVG